MEKFSYEKFHKANKKELKKIVDLRDELKARYPGSAIQVVVNNAIELELYEAIPDQPHVRILVRHSDINIARAVFITAVEALRKT